MDPLTALLSLLRDNLTGTVPADALASIEAAARDLFARFELVPKHEYEAHVAVLASLEAQVASLEQRLKALEQPK